MELSEEQLDQKISVPNSLSLADKELKSKLVGKAPAQKYIDILEDLDNDSEIYKTLHQEVMDAVGYEEPEEEEKEEKESGLVMLPMSSIKTLKAEIIEKMGLIEDTIRDIEFPEMPEFPEFPEFPTNIKVSNLSDIKIPDYPADILINNLSDIVIPDTINLNKPDWWKPTDFTGTNNTFKTSLSEASINIQGSLGLLDENMHDPTNPLKVHIVDKRGNVIEKFVGASSGGSSGGGGSTASQPRNINSGRTTVTTPATAVQVDSSSSFAIQIDVQAPKTNTGTIYVGDSTVSAVSGSETGIGLEPGDVYAFTMMSLNLIYIDSTVGSEGVTWNIFK